MTRFLLVRHATGAHVGRWLAGRTPGLSLEREGRAQAAELADRLATRDIDAVYASPLERARETAAAIAERLGREVQDAPGLVEFDFGAWTGRAIDELHGDPTWAHFNAYRSGTPAPAGELLLAVQARAMAELLRLRAAHPDRCVVVVSHADVIRAVLGHVAGVPIDLLLRFEIDPASVTEIELADWGARVLGVNRPG